MGLQDVLLRPAPAVRLPRGAGAVDPDLRGDLPHRARGARPSSPSEHGAHPAYDADPGRARASSSPTLWDVTGTQTERWAALRERIAAHGLRNSLLIAIAPTATIASIAGCYECIEPQVSNLFKRETLSGEFLQVNTALVRELKARGPVDRPRSREQVKRAEGSVAGRRRAARGRARASSARRGSCRSARSSTWRPPGSRTSTRASRSTSSWPARRSASSRSMYLHAWKAGPQDDLLPALATRDAHPAGDRRPGRRPPPPPLDRHHPLDEEALACSLENPENCEACQ